MGTTIKVLAQVDGYEQKWEEHKIAGHPLELALRRLGPITFQAFVHDELGQPLSDVEVISPNCDKNVITNDKGIFSFQGSRGTLCHLVFRKNGYESYNTDVPIDEMRDQRFLLPKIKPRSHEK